MTYKIGTLRRCTAKNIIHRTFSTAHTIFLVRLESYPIMSVMEK